MKSELTKSALFSRLTLTIFSLLLVFTSPLCVKAQTWHRVYSDDKKASVLFPNKAEKFETLSDSTPAGSVKTTVSSHEGDGFLFTISDSKIPGLALAFAGSDTILKNAAATVVGKAFGKMTSSKMQKIDGAPGVVVYYESANFSKKDHPGFRGVAAIFIVDGHLYSVNAILVNESEENKSAQDKMLKSIEVDK